MVLRQRNKLSLKRMAYKASITGSKLSRERYIAKRLKRKLIGNELFHKIKVCINHNDLGYVKIVINCKILVVKTLIFSPTHTIY